MHTTLFQVILDNIIILFQIIEDKQSKKILKNLGTILISHFLGPKVLVAYSGTPKSPALSSQKVIIYKNSTTHTLGNIIEFDTPFNN